MARARSARALDTPPAGIKVQGSVHETVEGGLEIQRTDEKKRLMMSKCNDILYYYLYFKEDKVIRL